MEYTRTLNWIKKHSDLAHHVAQWSKDPSSKVGAVIADEHGRVLGLGYNGFPRFVNDSPERYNDRDLKLKMVVHAEANAILNSHGDLNKKLLFCTHPCCSNCAGLIIQSGIKMVIYDVPEGDFMKRYADNFALTEQMFNEAGVLFYNRAKLNA